MNKRAHARDYRDDHAWKLARAARRKPPPPSITCPGCEMVSYNPNDIAHKYCGACHEFHDRMQRREALDVASR